MRRPCSTRCGTVILDGARTFRGGHFRGGQPPGIPEINTSPETSVVHVFQYGDR